MSKRKGLGGSSLEFQKVVPKFLQTLKQHEVKIDDKFKQEYLEKDDQDDQEDQLHKDAVERALKEENDLLLKEKEKEQQVQEEFNKEKEKRIHEDLILEQEAQAKGIERKILFKNPHNNVTTSSSTPSASIKRVSSKSLQKTTHDIKKSFQQSPKDQLKSKKKPTTASKLSFDIEDVE
ncbi:hypothetical protein DLAC_07955 [Tieghemostelium lacteum]|uniref:Uncharacterized protein n=1 Tax=Tieghemostelium lacteum TaxID=361077 RepID=A0A151ZAT2_TIELA|nr:hypothetical protein DLAC_07955 [Tieghemostelium lacteum]|eukprot:KYQ91053.1 hypothetical protein DLAC_07955 [Tieghemostelium lacteum]